MLHTFFQSFECPKISNSRVHPIVVRKLLYANLEYFKYKHCPSEQGVEAFSSPVGDGNAQAKHVSG